MRGRVLLVGATGRIGSSIAQLLAKAGFQLVLNDIGAQDDLEELAGSLPGGPHVPLSADVTDAAAVEDLLALADAAFDGIDVVVMALRSPRQPTSDADLELWTDTASMRLSVEVLGPAIVAQAAVRAFAARNITGRLIMVASPSQGSAMDATVGAALSGLGAGLAADHSRQVGVCLVRSSVPPDELAATVGWLVEHPSGIGVGVLHTVGA